MRVYLQAKLSIGEDLYNLSKEDSHHLLKVMRARIGTIIKVFNEEDGEFEAVLCDIKNNIAIVKIRKLVRLITPQNHKMALAFSPVKNVDAMFIVQKATELGATTLIPLIFERTIVKGFNTEKANQVAILAACQCERLTIPKIMPITTFKKLAIDASVNKLIALERIDVQKSNITLDHIPDPVIFIGPEGGFTKEERDCFFAMPNASFFSLGENILRAETAAIAAMAIYQYQRNVLC